MKTFLSGAAVAGLLLYIFDEELQPLVDSSKAFIVGLFKGKETKEADGANGTAGVNERGEVVIGTNRFIKSLSIREALLCLSLPLLLNLYRVRKLWDKLYPMAAQNNLEMLIDGAS